MAPPIVQNLVDQANLTFDAANITYVSARLGSKREQKLTPRRNLSDGGFDLSLKGALTGTGPLDAEITFVDPVSYVYNIAVFSALYAKIIP